MLIFHLVTNLPKVKVKLRSASKALSNIYYESFLRKIKLKAFIKHFEATQVSAKINILAKTLHHICLTEF